MDRPTTPDALRTRTSAKWPELDLIRGLAVVAMVYNHTASKWLPDAAVRDDLLGLLFTLGGYAPVLFFATTGLGYGIQAQHKGGTRSSDYGFVRKVVLLLLADMLLWMTPVTVVGMDFLGFIAVIMLVLELLRRNPRRGWWIALGLSLLIVGVRYVVVPRLAVAPAAGQVPTLVDWSLGLASPPGFSYPPLPWLAYGLVCFCAGITMQKHRNAILARRSQLITGLAILAALGLGAVSWKLAHGAQLQRWGSVNGTFFISGFAGILLAAALSLQLSPWRMSIKALGLRGVTSLAVVPIHYGVIASLGAIFDTTVQTDIGYLVIATVSVGLSIALSRQWAVVIQRLKGWAPGWTVLVGTSAICLASVAFIGTPWLRIAVMVVGQLALCALLVVERRTPSR